MDAALAKTEVFEGIGSKIVCLPDRVDFFVDPPRPSSIPIFLAFIGLLFTAIACIVAFVGGHYLAGAVAAAACVGTMYFAFWYNQKHALALNEREPQFVARLDDGTLRDEHDQVLCSLRRLRVRRTFDPRASLGGSNMLVVLGGGTWHKIYKAKGSLGVKAHLDLVEAALQARFDAAPDPQAKPVRAAPTDDAEA